MQIHFRQGLHRADVDSTGQPVIANSTSQGLVARTGNGPIVWSIAHYDKNYTVAEYNASVFVSAKTLTTAKLWVYIDLNLATGAKSYGNTTIAPVYGLTAPKTPVDGLHWFDVANAVMKVYTASNKRWNERVRLMIGQWDGTKFYSNPFGSSVNIKTSLAVRSGTIIFDAAGKVLIDSRNRFVTTEDKMFSDGAATHDFNLESNTTYALADENIPAFHVVKFSEFNKVVLASYSDTTETVVGIALNDATKGERVELCLQGKIINDAWKWSTVNASLWIDHAGALSEVDPFDLRSFAKRKVQVARVLDTNTIMFDQGFGGKGEKGDAGNVLGLVDASSETKGITKLSVDPVDPENPIAVGINDPILQEARVPLEHGHPATSITASTFGAFTGTNVQQALQYLQNAKLAITGGTVTGNISSTVSATEASHLTTLADVEAKVKSAKVNVKRYELNATYGTLTQAFNALPVANRTLAMNDLVFVVYGDNVYLWGGASGIVVAANDTQFVWVGKINFTMPDITVNIKTFTGKLILTQDPT